MLKSKNDRLMKKHPIKRTIKRVYKLKLIHSFADLITSPNDSACL